MADVFSGREKPGYFSALLAATFVGLLPVAVSLGFAFAAFTLEPARKSIGFIIGNVVPIVQHALFLHGAGLALVILILPLLRVRQPERRAYWLYAMACFAINPLILTISAALSWHTGGYAYTIWAGVVTGLAGVSGLLFLPLQRLFDRAFGRRRTA